MPPRATTPPPSGPPSTQCSRSPRSGPHGAPPRYPGPRPAGSGLTALLLCDSAAATFTRDGPRADVEYRDLGWARASGGAIGAKHIRAIRPFDAATGWHWHDMTGHFVY